MLQYKYLIFFPLVVIEGPIVTVAAGFLAYLGYFNVYILYLVAVAGDIVGDVLYYSIGYFGGKRIMSNGRFLWIKVEQVQKIKNHFDNHFGKTLLFGKWTHSVGGAILVASGIVRVPLKKFIKFNFIGTVPKTLVFLLVGYYFGHAYAKIDTYFGYITIAMLFLIITGATSYYFTRKR
ncbi:MAG: DedA family protein [Parcubacteria group bacterium]